MRLGFVTPRYGPDIVGGAEALVRDLAEHLVARGHEVRVLTTCAIDHLTWTNHHPPGQVSINGVPVERFPITEPVDPRDMASRYLPVELGTSMSVRDQWQLLRRMGYSQPLLDAIDSVANTMDALCFSPYLYATTVYGVAVRPSLSLILPCLHDEPFARIEVVQQALRTAAGILFNTAAERELATDLVPGIPPHRVVGSGIDPPDAEMIETVRAGHSPRDGMITYAGRREWGKNFHKLLEWTTAYNRALSRRGAAHLVIMGRGRFDLPASALPWVRDLGFVSRGEMLTTIAGSTAVVNLSTNESLSYLLLEGWACGVPAIVNAECSVTRTQCEESGGGLWVDTPEAFAEALDRLRSDSALVRKLGESGRRFVTTFYTWPAAIARLEQAVTELTHSA